MEVFLIRKRTTKKQQSFREVSMDDCNAGISQILLPHSHADKDFCRMEFFPCAQAFPPGIIPVRDRRFPHRACFPRDRGGHSRRTG